MVKELNKFVLAAILIVGLTVIVLTGMAVTANYSKVLRTTTTINASTTATTLAINTSVGVGSTGTYPFLQELTLCGNETNLSPSLLTSYYTIDEGSADGGTITLNQDGIVWDGADVNCSNLKYLADSSTQAVADKFTAGLAIFGTFSVILILAIVGKAIIGLFKKKD